MSAFCILVIAPWRMLFSSPGPGPPPHELLTIRMAGSTWSWFSRTQRSPSRAFSTNRKVPTPTPYSVAPGAAPWKRDVDAVPSPATIPATCVPWPPAPGVSVSSIATTIFVAGARHSENPNPEMPMAIRVPGTAQ